MVIKEFETYGPAKEIIVKPNDWTTILSVEAEVEKGDLVICWGDFEVSNENAKKLDIMVIYKLTGYVGNKSMPFARPHTTNTSRSRHHEAKTRIGKRRALASGLMRVDLEIFCNRDLIAEAKYAKIEGVIFGG